jgi:hypothetical protein
MKLRPSVASVISEHVVFCFTAIDALMRRSRGFVDTCQGSCILKGPALAVGLPHRLAELQERTHHLPSEKGTPGRDVGGFTDRARP